MDAASSGGTRASWAHRLAAPGRLGDLWALAAVVVASLVFRVHVSEQCSLWLDEAKTRWDISRSWHRVLAGPTHDHPPLMYVLVRLATALLGKSDTALRAVSLAFGCVLLAAVYRACVELGLSSRRALGAAASLAITPFFLANATEARHYAILAALVTLGLVFVLRVLRDPLHVRAFAGFCVCGALASATHYFGIAYTLALLATAAFGMRRAWRPLLASARRGLACAASLAGLLVVLGWLGVKAARVGHDYSVGVHSGVVLDWGFAVSVWHEFSFAGNPWLQALELPLAFAGLLLLGRGLEGVARFVPLALGFGPCILAVAVSAKHPLAARYLAPSFVLYHVGACAGLFALVERVRSRLALANATWRRAAVWVLLALPLAVRVAEYPAGYGAGNVYYRGLQQYFMSRLARDTVLVAYRGSYGRRVMDQVYPVNRPVVALEKFRPVRGIRHYLIAEFLIHDEERPRYEALIRRHFGLSSRAWEALPLVPLPRSTYQPAVTARLVSLDASSRRR